MGCLIRGAEDLSAAGPQANESPEMSGPFFEVFVIG
jgi:hypothetical protein